MLDEKRALALIDASRRQSAEPSADGTCHRQLSADGRQCTITWSSFDADDLDRLVSEEVSRARRRGYSLEWKIYSHDGHEGLEQRLCSAGFVAGPEERVLVLPAREDVLMRLPVSTHEIHRVQDSAGLEHVARISRAVGRSDVDAERRRLGEALRRMPEQLSVYVAYADGEPAACGRIHFDGGGRLAGLGGGRTTPANRRRGLYTALVRIRLQEAIARGFEQLVVDALPTSEPILLKRGFQAVSRTRPFVLSSDR